MLGGKRPLPIGTHWIMLDYVYAVQFVEKDNVRFLKTIIPSRKLNKKYRENK